MEIGTRCAMPLVMGLLAACGGDAPEFAVEQVGVTVRSDAAFAHRPDLPDRIRRTMDAALAYWGGSWEDLAGVTVVLEGSLHVRCGAATGASGCFDGDIRVSTRDPGFVFACVEQTTLVHEVGHAVIGDPDHLDARWRDFAVVEQKLSGRRGYAADGADEPCPIYPSVWRHPPGARH